MRHDKGMEIRDQQSQPERARTNWTLPMERYLIELLVDQIKKGSKSEKGFTKDAWKEMTTLLNKKFTLQLNKENVKNRHKAFRKQWVLMKGIIDQSGFGWDPERQMVSAKDAIWDAYIAAHPKAKQYRRQILPDYNALCTIFGDRNADGKFSRTCNEVNADCKESTSLVVGMRPSTASFHSPDIAATQEVLLDDAHGLSHLGEDVGETCGGDKRQSETPSSSQLSKKGRTTQGVLLDDVRGSSHLGEDVRETNRENRCRSEMPPLSRLTKKGMITQGVLLDNAHGLSDSGEDVEETSRHNKHRSEMPSSSRLAKKGMITQAVLLDNAHGSSHSGEDVGETSRQNKHRSETPSSLHLLMRGQVTISDALVDAIREMASAVRALADRQKYVDTPALTLQEKCISVLDQMPDLDYGIYLQAAELFEDEKKAKTFLVLSEGARKDWLLMKLGPGRL